MAKKSSGKLKHQIHESGGEALEAAQAKNAGNNFEWHFGRITSLGSYTVAGGRSSLRLPIPRSGSIDSSKTLRLGQTHRTAKRSCAVNSYHLFRADGGYAFTGRARLLPS